MQSSMNIIYRALFFLVLCLFPFLSFAQIAEGVKKDSTGTAIPEAIKVTNIIQGVEEANE